MVYTQSSDTSHADRDAWGEWRPAQGRAWAIAYVAEEVEGDDGSIIGLSHYHRPLAVSLRAGETVPDALGLSPVDRIIHAIALTRNQFREFVSYYAAVDALRDAIPCAEF